MITIRTVDALRAVVSGWRKTDQSVGVVPTMGALHAGHMSLIEAAKAGSDRVIATIFVNPAQFNNPSDLENYPRTEQSDAELLAAQGVDVLFAPAPDEVYPDGFVTNVSVARLTEGYCGSTRPGHFDGVATVVTKLFLMSGADRAYFGEKDWQQVQIVRRLAMDLNIPIEVVGCATVRERDGLALSSRNVRLTPEDRPKAPALHAAMTGAAAAMRTGTPVRVALEAADQAIRAAGFGAIDYLDLCDAATLAPMEVLDRPARLLAAAWLGEVRLIDNIAVDET
ncbi:MAG: pantoate--beta-alanine ligase [Albidovulum sp.]